MSKKKESLFRIILNKDYICGYMAKTEGFEKPKAKKDYRWLIFLLVPIVWDIVARFIF